MFNFLKRTGVLIAIVILCAACNQSIGMGKSVDWEPPVLTLEPGPNPRYINTHTALRGTVTDNVAVDRVVLIDSSSRTEIARAAVNGDNWEIELHFTEEDNGRQIPVNIIAYDKSGNSGDSSIKSLMLIIDIHPPVFEMIEIIRAPSKIAWLEKYFDLKNLEETDPRGEESGDINRYQNGWFEFHANIVEEETRIENARLSIYDAQDYENEVLLLTLEKTADSTLYSPRWLVKAEDIIAAGESLIGNYSEKYYDNGERMYFRVSITAYDRGNNDGSLRAMVEDQDYFCLWERADEPRGFLDQTIVMSHVITKGQMLPVQIFDDDTLNRVWADMLTDEQWADEIEGTTEREKLNALWTRLSSGQTVHNWKADDFHPGYDSGDAVIHELLNGKAVDEDMTFVKTGDKQTDYGNYKLFVLAEDKKLAPHTGDAAASRWSGRVYNITIADENAPALIFDTVDTTAADYDSSKHPGYDVIPAARTGNSPEENTFPRLRNKQYFEINGYALVENSQKIGRITALRMAWIPSGVPGGAAAAVQAVQDALRHEGTEHAATFPFPDGVQHWDLTSGLIMGTEEKIGADANEVPYTKQVFKKTFDILGGQDDLKPGYRNFYYRGQFENTSKLFVFYAQDQYSRYVFRTLRLLGNNTPPGMTVYDITNMPGLEGLSAPNYFDYNEDNERYQAELTAFQSDAYSAIKEQVKITPVKDADRASPYQTYARGTALKYWVTTEGSGDIAIASVTMQDITDEKNIKTMGYYDTAAQSLSFCESLPEVAQRVFLFIGRDTLGNEIHIQRSVAVTTTAFLTSVSSSNENASYGKGEIIRLQAAFSAPVIVQSNSAGDGPLLNIRYSYYDEATKTSSYVIKSIPYTGDFNRPLLYLYFDWEVPAGAEGLLQTMDAAPAPNDKGGSAASETDRPVKLNGARIIDAARQEPAFIPGDYSMPGWTTEKDSLQGTLLPVPDPDTGRRRSGKEIMLDGTPPRFVSLEAGGKDPYLPDGTNPDMLYFKADETITFTLFANKSIYSTSSAAKPKIAFDILLPGEASPSGGVFYAELQRAETLTSANGAVIDGMFFSVSANGLPQEGELVNIRPFDEAGVTYIADDLGNPFDTAGFKLTYNRRLFIDKKNPPVPVPLVNDQTLATGIVHTYNANPVMRIASMAPADEPWGGIITEYSTDSGINWLEYTAGDSITIQPGSWGLTARRADKAGNTIQSTPIRVEVNDTFPRLVAISVIQQNGYYPAAGDSLVFNLTFAEAVTITNNANVSILLADRILGVGAASDGSDIYSRKLTTTGSNGETVSTISFTWNITDAKEMYNGLYIKEIDFTALTDRFGNTGHSGVADPGAPAPYQITIDAIPSYKCANLNGGLRVDNIPPAVTGITPVNANGKTGNITTSVSGDNRTITIQFREPMQKGIGTITLKPRGATESDYAIPPVFENEGYYATYDATGKETRYTDYAEGRTWVAGLYDIYNNSVLNATDRNALTQSTTGANNSTTIDTTNPSMSRLALKPRTGQSAGPYMRLTHGLKKSLGYTGNYNNTTPGANGASAAGEFMVPDTATKWVLDYNYSITQNVTAINEIRRVLDKAKFRWQEFDVTSSAVTISGSTVTVTLPEPLLQGLRWELSYTAGTFTDMAGNSAPVFPAATGDTANYWFWSNGVQTPVIRVNRRSYDARAVGAGPTNLAPTTTRTHADPGATTDWNTATIAVTDLNGWGIADFTSVHYRIETETPGARIYYNTILGREVYRTGTTPNLSIGSAQVATGAYNVNWTGAVARGGDVTGTTAANWDATDNSAGTWVLPNLIRRAGSGGNEAVTGTYTVLENGVTNTRTLQGNHRGLRSYNKDATEAELFTETNLAMSNYIATAGGGQLVMTGFTNTEASKNYVVAQARVDHVNNTYTSATYTSVKGAEGIFRSVVAIRQTAATNPTVVEGSNIKNGMPSIAGFPVRDAEETGDNRFIKLFFNTGTGNQFLWVSTEIVSQWYFIMWGNGGTHQRSGEVNNYLTAGYGDLTFGFNVDHY